MSRRHLSETTGSQRLVYGSLAGIAALALPLPLDWQLHGLLGWSVGVTVYLVLAWWLCIRFDAARPAQKSVKLPVQRQRQSERRNAGQRPINKAL